MKVELLTSGPPAPRPDMSKGPHVLFVLDGFPKALGGGERIVLRMAALLPRYGYRASILTLGMHPQSEFHPANAPCPVYLLPLTNAYGPGAWRGALALRQFLRQHDVSIVQTFFESSDLWAGLVTRLFSPAKLIWNRRDMGILRGKKHVLAYRALREMPHAVFAVSERVAQHVIQVDGVAPARVHVIHNGLDLSTVTHVEAPRPDQARVVATIGNVRRVKGHDVFVRAAAKVIAALPDTRFTVAGEILEPEYFSELQALIQELGLKQRFTFAGKIADLSSYLAQADVFVLPSRSEGFSNALIEAMAAGLPAIATDVGGNGEAIRTGETGLLVPSEDADSLAEAVLQVLRDPALAERFGTAAREAVMQSFSAEAMMRKVAQVFSSFPRE